MNVFQPMAARASGEIFGYNVITLQYYDRYRIPVMHTETNLVQGPSSNEAVELVMEKWANVIRVRNDGVPVSGFTVHSDGPGRLGQCPAGKTTTM